MKTYLKKKDWETLDKGFKVGLIEGVLVGGVFMIAGILFLFFLYVGVIDFGQGDLSLKFINSQQEKGYERIAGDWQENEFVKSLSYICSFQKTEKQKVECVYYYVNNVFDYEVHGIGNQLRRSPEEIILEGAVCRDYSVLYASIISSFNISYEFVHEPIHIYLMVYPEGYDCKLDMDYLSCVEN